MKASPKNPCRGRPPKPAMSAKSRTITIRLTPGEDSEIREAAAAACLTIRDFLVSRSLHFGRLAQTTAGRADTAAGD